MKWQKGQQVQKRAEVQTLAPYKDNYNKEKAYY